MAKSKNIELTVEVRENTGTGSARAARRAGNVPGIIYGGGVDPVAIEMPENEVIKAINSGQFIGNMVSLSHSGKKQKAITKDIQFHVVNDRPMHVDFFRVKESDIIEVEVSVNFLNEDICPGLKQGGTLNVVRYSIEVSCPAGSIPDQIDIDLAEVQMDETIHISDIKFPENVTSAITDRDPTILTVQATRSEAEADEDEEAPAADEVEVIGAKEGDDAEGEG